MIEKKYKIRYGSPNIFLNEDDILEIQDILKSGWVSIGKHVRELEIVFEKRFGVKYAIACSSATSGLIIAIKSAGWENKRIAVPSFTWPSTVYAIESTKNNTPVFCDIDKDTWIMDMSTVKNYDAVVCVDTFGNQANIDGNGVPVIYDSAHGFDLPNLGHRGLAEVVSFSFTKLVTAMEGGMILTNDDAFADTAYELRRLSSRMGEINAFIAKKSIKYYDEVYDSLKKDMIQIYTDNLEFDFVKQKIETATNYSTFCICMENSSIRNLSLCEMEKNNIETKVYYDPIVSGLSNTDYVYSRIIALPTHSNLTKEMQMEIIKILNEVSTSSNTPGKRYMKKSGFIKK